MSSTPPPGGGGKVLYYISYIGMCRPIGLGFCAVLVLKTGIHFAHFGLESGMVFEGTTGVYERIYRFNSKLMSKKEGEICEFEIDSKNLFVCALI